MRCLKRVASGSIPDQGGHGFVVVRPLPTVHPAEALSSREAGLTITALPCSKQGLPEPMALYTVTRTMLFPDSDVFCGGIDLPPRPPPFTTLRNPLCSLSVSVPNGATETCINPNVAPWGCKCYGYLSAKQEQINSTIIIELGECLENCTAM